MYRFYWAIFINLFRAPYLISHLDYVAKHKQKYTKEERYKAIMTFVNMIKNTLIVRTKVYGRENIPKEDGYIMYANHQGKYDALGVMYAHQKIFSIIMDEAKSHVLVTRQVMDLCDGIGLEIDNPRQGIKVIMEMADRASKGENFLIFPEGGYNHNRNNLQEFKAGSFKAALKAQVPIVPICLVDSYKVFEGVRFGRITTEVHYLEPIQYDEYKDMLTQDIAQLVKGRIQAKMDERMLAKKSLRKNVWKSIKGFLFNK